MNIKSEILNTKFFNFDLLPLNSIIIIAVASTILSFIIINTGEAFWFKLIWLLLGLVVVIIVAGENPSIKDAGKKGVLILILTLLLIEIPLYFYSNIGTIIPIKTIVTDHIETEVIIVDNQRVNREVKTKVITFYDADTMERIGKRSMNEDEKEKLEMYKDIIGKEFYIEYLPFFVYSTKFKYIKGAKNENPL